MNTNMNKKIYILDCNQWISEKESNSLAYQSTQSAMLKSCDFIAAIRFLFFCKKESRSISVALFLS